MKQHLFVIVVALSTALTAGTEEIPDEWLTVAEKSGFRATSTFAETMEYLHKVQAEAPEVIRVTSFGQSAEGRELPLVIVSSDSAFTPEAARKTGKPILLMQSGIHAGEIAGKEATLMLLREIALGHRVDLADAAITLFAPIYNLDGHERVSPHNRPNQDGPVEGMGFRTTTAGINLNRDWLRLASPEARAMATLVADWRPHLHVDNHVTNGSDHAWVLTWMVADSPRLDPEVDAWIDRHLPKALAATAAAGHPNGPYLSFVNWNDPSSGVDWTGIQLPRYSTGYFPLLHRPSILVEMHAHKPFRDRVLANRDFMDGLMLEAGRAGDGLVDAVAAAEARTVARGAGDAEPSTIVVRWTSGEEADTIVWPSYRRTIETSAATGGSMTVYHRGELDPLEIEWRHSAEPELEIARPRGYIVHAGWTQLADLVAAHHLVAQPIADPVELDVETIRVADPSFAATPFQGTIMIDEFTVTRQLERREIPAGSLWIPADQPDFEVAVQLFEPEAPDSLLRWGALSSIFELKTYIGSVELDALVSDMLADDAVRRRWAAELADPEFASNRRARYLWWYRQTPHWDERMGLLPIYRVPAVPPFGQTADE